MVDKTKDKKVIGIRKDVIVNGPEKPIPINALVELTKELYEQALDGTLRTLAFSACTTNTLQSNFGIAGEFDYHWTLMHAQLTALSSEYYLNEVLPALTGVYPEDMIDD